MGIFWMPTSPSHRASVSSLVHYVFGQPNPRLSIYYEGKQMKIW